MIDERDAAVAMPAGGGESAGHTISRRVTLPTGRAVVGALLVTLAVVGLFVSYRRAEAGPHSTYVVVAARVPAGARITTDDLVVRALELAPDVAALATTDPDAAVGAVALETLLPGQLLQPQAILPASPSGHAEEESFEVSIALDRARALGGVLRPGERVDVVATVTDGRESCTSVLAPAARVVQVSGGGDSAFGNGGDITVTLAIVGTDEVLAAVFAADRADASLVRATRAGSRSLGGSYCGPPSSSADDEPGT